MLAGQPSSSYCRLAWLLEVVALKGVALEGLLLGVKS